MQDWDMKKKQDFVHAMGKGHKKLEFVHKMAKLGLQHFDDGGTVLAGPAASGIRNESNPNTGIIGSINGALGLNNNFQASGSPVQAGTNNSQLNNSYSGVQTGLQYQQSLANTLGPQAAIAAQNQNDLALRLNAEANGQGPNVAENELSQATGNNISNQAALMAGQRGASSNVGLIARNAARQGADIQQNSAGEAATLQAQQQIAAQQGEANLAGAQIAQAGQAGNNASSAQISEQNTLQGANTSYNNTNANVQGNINSTNAQTAAANQNKAGNLVGGLLSGASSVAASLGLAKGGLVTKEKYAEGGEVSAPCSVSDGYMKKMAKGGLVGNPLVSYQGYSGNAPQSFAGQYLNGGASSGGSSPSMAGVSSLPQYVDEGIGKGSGKKASSDSSSSAGTGTALGSTEGDYSTLTSDEAASSRGDLSTLVPDALAMGGKVGRKLAANGGKVKASSSDQKAVAKNNSYSNDKIPALLSEGEIVIPREITMHKMAPEKAAAFVRKELAKKRVKRGKL